jgi:hypothetical protein
VDEVPTASDAMVVQYRVTGFDRETPWIRNPVMRVPGLAFYFQPTNPAASLRCAFVQHNFIRRWAALGT